MAVKRIQGITLIELMIVVVIVGILAAIAYPSYQNHIRNTRAAMAQADLMELAQFMERRYTLNNTYLIAANNAAIEALWPFTESPRDGNSAAYGLSLVGTTDDTSFTIQAVPSGSQNGHRCGTMTINQAGVRTAAQTDCWR